ncbi:MAG: hypothetical protein ACEPO8_02895 [Rhodothermaceae bacterium]
MKSKNKHTFHIPVMGIGFTVDTPAKAAQYGISSVISLVDDSLMEKMREFYSKKLNLPFKEISNKSEDKRAKRITEYLNLIDKMVKDNFEEMKNSFSKKSSELEQYFDMLPDFSELKEEFNKKIKENTCLNDISNWLKKNLTAGAIDVNIMTKLDKANKKGSETLPAEYNDAHAALRGFANSSLESSIVLSAGINPKLYSYFENFDDFFPDENGNIKKKVIIKVSDYRSALIQGKFLAKKGIWVSEYRIESGLNCGGHAFATDGYLLGPILQEFKENRTSLFDNNLQLFTSALKAKNKPVPNNLPEMKITVQGGVGTAEEHNFLIDHYGVDSVGWGSPFLLSPDVTNVDKKTLNLLSEATEKDFYLSDISPLGVKFNNVRNNSKDIEKMELIKSGKPGSACPKRYLALNKDSQGNSICTASRKFIKEKFAEIEARFLSKQEEQKEKEKVTEKSCICVGLGTAALIKNDLDTKVEGPGVSVCPGPNLAYFSKITSLKEMAQHIYGKINLITSNDRPHMFIKELNMYVDHLREKVEELQKSHSEKQAKYVDDFISNLNDGISYYKDLFSEMKLKVHEIKNEIICELENIENEILSINRNLEKNLVAI